MDWKNGVFRREDNNENWWISYSDICGGDSQSPRMFCDYDKFSPRKEPKFVLATITIVGEGKYDIRGVDLISCEIRPINMEKYHGIPEKEAILQSIRISEKNSS